LIEDANLEIAGRARRAQADPAGGEAWPTVGARLRVRLRDSVANARFVGSVHAGMADAMAERTHSHADVKARFTRR
jgi:hypothetical protein